MAQRDQGLAFVIDGLLLLLGPVLSGLTVYFQIDGRQTGGHASFVKDKTRTHLKRLSMKFEAVHSG